MILPQTSTQTLMLMIFSLICLGSWAITFKMTGKWRFELYCMDFALGAMLAVVIYAATAGSLGFDGFSFLDDLMHAGKRQWFFAFLAGVVFNLGNMLLIAAVSVAGMAVAFPMGMGLGLLLGFGLGQMIRKEGDPMMLFLGFLLILMSMAFSALAYSNRVAARAQAILFEAQQSRRKPPRVAGALKGIVLSVAAGLLLASYLPLLTKARPLEFGLGPYSLMFVFMAGVFSSTLVYTIFFANLPVEGEPIGFADYFKGRPKTHLLGLVGGIVWSSGMLATLLLESPDVQSTVTAGTQGWFIYGIPVIGAVWGVIAWGEFRNTSGRVQVTSYLMLLALAVGTALVSLAPKFVKAA